MIGEKENKDESNKLSKSFSYLSNIKSKLILKIIFSYIKDESFKYKIFKYSKEFQKKFNLNYAEFSLFKSIEKVNISSYLLISYDSFDNSPKNYLNEILSKLNIKESELEKYLLYYYRKESNSRNKDYDEIYFSIFSPFFDFLIENGKDFFGKLFKIGIKTENIIKYNLQSVYKSAFKKLNKYNVKYSSLYYTFEKNEEIKYLNDLDINFSNIKNLSITKYNTMNGYNLANLKVDFDENLLNNLLYLNFTCYEKINSDALEKLNDFIRLIHLYLDASFKSEFLFKLDTLKYLSIDCYNLSFDKNIFNNLEKLYIKNSKLFSKNLIEFPELIECTINNQEFHKFINFKSLKKLKSLEAYPYCFQLLENSPLISYDMIKDYGRKIDKNILEKLLSSETIEKTDLYLDDFLDEDMSDIKIKNKSIKKLGVFIKREIHFSIEKFQNLFLNLKEFAFISYKNCKKNNLEIKEDINSQINNLNVKMGYKDIKLHCGPFKYLEKINLEFYNIISNIKACFPIFNNKCEIIFESLTKFSVLFRKAIDIEILENIYNNLNNIPKLKDFSITINIKIIRLIDKDFYLKFIRKLLSLKLNSITYEYKDFYDFDFYLKKNELLEIYPNFKTEDIRNIKIRKYTR